MDEDKLPDHIDICVCKVIPANKQAAGAFLHLFSDPSSNIIKLNAVPFLTKNQFKMSNQLLNKEFWNVYPNLKLACAS